MSTTHSTIEWTDRTWNPLRGCTPVDEGCRNCYAAGIAWRYNGAGLPFEGLAKRVDGRAVFNGRIRQVPEALTEPLRWKKPARIFVNSVSDLFHESVPESYIDQVLAVIALSPQHIFQVLTKRPERMRAHVEGILADQKLGISRLGAVALHFGFCGPAAPHGGPKWPLPNLWLGTSVSDQPSADERVPELLATPAAVRFVSYEPALGPVDFNHVPWKRSRDPFGSTWGVDALAGVWTRAHDGGGENYGIDHDVKPPWPGPASRLDWIICGGESGPGARPMHPDWARAVRDQCAAAGVAFTFKQWGEWVGFQNVAADTFRPNSIQPEQVRYVWPSGHAVQIGQYSVFDDPSLLKKDYALVVRAGKKRAGRLLDGVLHDASPQPRRGE